VEFDNPFIFKYVRRFRCPNVFFAQDLLPSADRARRMLAYELLVATGAVRNLIRKNQLHHLELGTELIGRFYCFVTVNPDMLWSKNFLAVVFS
jgi:Tfp pilus assembly pilus retraction ATPase PilT